MVGARSYSRTGALGAAGHLKSIFEEPVGPSRRSVSPSCVTSARRGVPFVETSPNIGARGHGCCRDFDFQYPVTSIVDRRSGWLAAHYRRSTPDRRRSVCLGWASVLLVFRWLAWAWLVLVWVSLAPRLRLGRAIGLARLASPDTASGS